MVNDLFSVAGKRVLLTGSAGGLGMAILGGFLYAGATVYAVSRRTNTDWMGLDKDFPSNLIPMIYDLANEEQCNQLAEAVEKFHGGCDVLINNAGVSYGTENPYGLDNLRRTMAVVFDAAFILSSGIAPQMAARGSGSIINITSINAERAFPGNPSYVSAKGGLRMLTKALARDFGQKGVRANNLSPGYVHTNMTRKSFADSQLHEERRSHTMLGRWGKPEDMVGPCIFLASDASAYITGTDLHVDGGWLAKGM